jgi:hypothetical protein
MPVTHLIRVKGLLFWIFCLAIDRNFLILPSGYHIMKLVFISPGGSVHNRQVKP